MIHPDLFREKKENGIVWISIGTFTLILTTVINTEYSALYRAMAWWLDAVSRFLSGVRFL